MALTSVDVYLPQVDEYKLTLHRETDDDWETLVSGRFTNSAVGWCTVNLPEPIPIDYLNNLWVVFYNDNSQYNYVAAFTEGYEGSDNARLYVGSDGYWYAINRDISWLMMINAVDDDYAYSVYRNGLLIATDITQTSYNDYNLANGVYEYTIRTQYYDQLSVPSVTATAIIGHGVGEEDANLLEVFPNPTNDIVTVRCEQIESISVVSMTGQEIISKEVHNDHVELDMANVPSGIYMLRVYTTDGSRWITRIAKR